MASVITSLYNGGIRVLEITFNQKSETKLEDTAFAIRLAKSLLLSYYITKSNFVNTFH